MQYPIFHLEFLIRSRMPNDFHNLSQEAIAVGKGKHTVHRFSNFVIRKRKWIEKIFAVAVVLSIIALCFVRVNYDLSKYLPDDAASKAGLNVMDEEFGYPGTARVMVGDVSLYEAKLYKDRIEAVDGVNMVTRADTAPTSINPNFYQLRDDPGLLQGRMRRDGYHF
ncbi:MAG: hypothetical protein ACLS8R_03615 [Anaeromassilibacillus sp.]